MPKQKNQIATFAAGCFWGVEYKFDKVKGVVNTTVGYIGGHLKNPSYENVCSDETGHAEAVQVEYDQKQVSYEELLNVFWSIHDPTQLNKQGPDIGLQYRSAIFYHNEKQKQAALKSKEKLEMSVNRSRMRGSQDSLANSPISEHDQKPKVFDKSGKYNKPIVTEIVPAKEFYKAEEYHQRYWEKNKNFVCHI